MRAPKTTLLPAALLGLLALAAAPTPADVVIADDLIVDGSACVGNDCVNGESFGFDTVRLKENNVRLHFDDTSISASFPRNDWRLVANATSNGGSSYFGIEDATASRVPFRVEAGARNHALYVEADGDVGIGTSNPVVDLEIVSGNTPTVRLHQDGSSGFSSQTWDLAGNEANFFVRDVTNASRLPFRIRPGAPSETLTLAADGDVGIGTDNPADRLHVENTGGNDTDDFVVTSLGDVGSGTTAPAEEMEIVRSDGDDVILQLLSTEAQNAGITMANSADFFTNFVNSSGNFVISTDGAAGIEFQINGANGNVTIQNDLTVNGTIFGTVSSSRAVKTAIEPVDPAEVLARVAAMPMAEWSYALGTPADRERHLGPMAEDFHAAFGLGRDETSISLVDYSGVALAAIQGLDRLIEEDGRQLELLEAQNAALRERLAALEARLAAE